MRALGRPGRTWAFYIEANLKGLLADFEGFDWFMWVKLYLKAILKVTCL
jgi:hypothetical protein